MSFLGNLGAPRPMTREEIEREQQRLARRQQEQRGRKIDSAPAGIALLVDALSDAYSGYQTNRAQQANQDYNQQVMASLIGGGGSAPAEALQPVTGAPQATAQPAAPEQWRPQQADPADSNVMEPFIAAARESGLTNPYALAALAAYGERESGWSAGNLNRTWSDPSESGGAGTSGGALSWRNERLDNLRKFAADAGEQGLGSPVTQAKFFMTENPDLVAKLNAAGSEEDANRAFADRWRFAGYNDPNSQEFRARQEAIGRYVPMFSGQQAQQPSGGDVAQALTGQQQQPSGGPSQQELLRAMTDPRVDESTKAVAASLLRQQQQQQQALSEQQAQQERRIADQQQWEQRQQYEQQMRQADPAYQAQLESTRLGLQRERANMEMPADVRALQARAVESGLQPGTPEYQEFMRSGGRGPLVAVNTGENRSEFVKESDKKAAERMDTYVSEGAAAQGMLSDMMTLSDLAKGFRPGAGAQFLSVASPYLQMVGINTDKMSDIQAFEAISNRLAPMMRPAGSGASSDFDARQFTRSLPNIANTEAGNAIINQTFQAVSQNKIQAAEIAGAAQRGEISWQDADKQIRSLPSPFDAYKAFRKDNPDLFGERKSGTEQGSPRVRRYNPQTGVIE